MTKGFYSIERGEKTERFSSRSALFQRVNELQADGIDVQFKCNTKTVIGAYVVTFYVV